MRYLYYCNSTYQLLNALNLHWHRKNANFENIKDYHGDLMLLNAFSTAKVIAEKVQSEFDNVYFVNRVINKGRFHSFKSIDRIINPLHFLKDSGIENPKDLKNKYDKIVCAKFSKAPAAVWQLNKNCRVDLFEDGLASYNDSVDLESPSKTYRIFFKYFNFGRLFYDFDYLYLSQPDLYSGEFTNRLRKVPLFNHDYLNSIGQLLSNEEEHDSENSRMIWIGMANGKDINKEIQSIVEKYKNDVMYRAHPRYQNYPSGVPVSKDKTIWELKIAKMDNLDSVCLFSINSTAAFTPKLLYDKEPSLIFTELLLNGKDSKFLSTIENLKNIYRDKAKIKVPSNNEELSKDLKDIMGY